MGLLDDAIREHLDLKRRHGASDDEIAQKEAEALGPARREFPREAAQDVAVDDRPVHVDEDEAAPAAFGDPLSEEISDLERISDPPVFDHLADEPEAAVDPAPPPVESPAPSRVELADTEEYRFEEDEGEDDDAYGEDDDDDDFDEDDDFSDLDDDDDDDADDEDDDEDLLGDTPEFLQDTPEHDRLWFEQKPPRDFDFE
ncbi:MAG TPA: hypothetical protein VN606_09545 [Thermoleophilaceae bacterium]|nr:hypothetical protein [Thermoleophilaceae bacterium]